MFEMIHLKFAIGNNQVYCPIKMINGLTRSEIFMTGQSKMQHYDRLKTISTSKSKYFQPCKQLVSYQKQSKKRHARARSFLKEQSKRELKFENRKLVMSMIRIATRENSQFEASTKKKNRRHSSERKIICSQEINRKRREKQIKDQNKRIVKNIVYQKTTYPVQQNEKSYQESRERLDRINKFSHMSRITKSSSKFTNSNKKPLLLEPLDLGQSMLFDSSWKLKLSESKVENPEQSPNIIKLGDSLEGAQNKKLTRSGQRVKLKTCN